MNGTFEVKDGKIVATRPTGDFTRAALVDTMGHVATEEAAQRRSPEAMGPEILRTEQGLTARRGEIVGLAGLAGHGQAEALARLYIERTSAWRPGKGAHMVFVAGDRGRASNFWYGAAKAAFAAVLSGLRQKYARTSLHVMTVKPGFVATRMTEGMDLPPALTATPEAVAEDIYRGWRKGRNVLYSKPVWRLVMLIIRLLPEALFKRTRI